MNEYETFDVANNMKEVNDISKQFWGHTNYVITDDEIEMLKQGKILVGGDGEYTYSIEYKP